MVIKCHRVCVVAVYGVCVAEEVLFSDLFQKINRRDKAQDRAILVTNRAVYNLKPSNFASCKRRIPVELVDAVTVSQVRNVTHS